jgi:hypothetical protein
VANEKHLYCTARGDWNASDLALETWQMGIRLWADTSVPDDFGHLPSTGDFEAAADSGSDSGGTWTSSFAWNEIGGSVIVPGDYLTEQAAPAWKTFIESAGLSSLLRLKTVHLYPIQSTGLAFEGRSAVYTYNTPPVGASSAQLLPTECSICVSWGTGTPGRRGRGRIFVPGIVTTPLDSHAFVGSSGRSNLVSQGQALAQNLAVEGAAPGDPHVRPAIIGAPWTQYSVITSTSVGSVVDAQRRRRRQLTEVRTSLAVTY